MAKEEKNKFFFFYIFLSFSISIVQGTHIVLEIGIDMQFQCGFIFFFDLLLIRCRFNLHEMLDETNRNYEKKKLMEKSVDSLLFLSVNSATVTYTYNRKEKEKK